jgi:hypothetical protein
MAPLGMTPLCSGNDLAAALDAAAGRLDEMVPQRLVRETVRLGAKDKLRFPPKEFRAAALASIASGDDVALV